MRERPSAEIRAELEFIARRAEQLRDELDARRPQFQRPVQVNQTLRLLQGGQS